MLNASLLRVMPSKNNTNIETDFTEEEKNNTLDSLLSKLSFNDEKEEKIDG